MDPPPLTHGVKESAKYEYQPKTELHQTWSAPQMLDEKSGIGGALHVMIRFETGSFPKNPGLIISFLVLRPFGTRWPPPSDSLEQATP